MSIRELEGMALSYAVGAVLAVLSGSAGADGLVDVWGPAGAGGLVAEAGGLVAEAEGWSSAEAGGRGLAEAAGVAEAGWVAEAEKVSIVALLVSTISPADAPTAPLPGLGRQSWLYGARRHRSKGERETHRPQRSDAATLLDAIKLGAARDYTLAA